MPYFYGSVPYKLLKLDIWCGAFGLLFCILIVFDSIRINAIVRQFFQSIEISKQTLKKYICFFFKLKNKTKYTNTQKKSYNI